MNNSQVAHLWANQSKPKATGSHFYFNGDTIYSYGPHFPIARHYRGVVLFTRREYSVTTRRHIGHASSACLHLKTFMVTDVQREPVQLDVDAYSADIARAKLLAARKRTSGHKLICLRNVDRLVAEANEFCARFNFKERFSGIDDGELAELKAQAAKESAIMAQETKLKKAKLDADNKLSISEWLSGNRQSLPYSIEKVYLRRNSIGETDVLQTSRGAVVPLAEAEKAFRFILLNRETGWHRNGETFKVGDFQLDAVNAQGIVAGCHRIDWQEIERFAATQGW